MISYSVNATRPIGTVEMMTPATGTNEQRNTNTDKNPTPETCKTRRPKAVKAVFTTAMALCACIAFPKIAPKVPITGAISSYTMERRDCLRDCTPRLIAGISQTSMKEKIRLTRLCNQQKHSRL
jgi:hypothetical protein